MKRYLIFGSPGYYPSGGMYDFRGSFDTIEDAKALANEPFESAARGSDWAHIVDYETMEIILEADIDENFIKDNPSMPTPSPGHWVRKITWDTPIIHGPDTADNEFVKIREILPDSPTVEELQAKIAELEKDADYTREMTGKTCDLWATRYTKANERIASLESTIQVSLDAGNEFDEQSALKAAQDNYPSIRGVSDINLKVQARAVFIEGARWAWSAKPTRPLTDLTAAELVEHPAVKALVEALEHYEDIPIWKVAGVDSSGPEPEEIENEEFIAAEALKPFRGEG